MGETLRRAFNGDIEIRGDGDGRTIRGLAVPFNQPTRIREFFDEYDEIFVQGSFAKTIAERGQKVKYLYQHERSEPIGRATMWREDAAGLYGEWYISKTPLGDTVLELVRDGVIDSNSIGFDPITAETTPRRGDVPFVTRTEVRLREVSAVTFPAYEGATISGVRALDDEAIQRAVGFANDLRAGNTLSAQNAAKLNHVLSLVASADRAVDEAQPLLAALLGVPNPDVEQDAEDEADDGDQPRGLNVDTMRRKALLLGIRL